MHPQALRHYKILEKVGEGGMGLVYKAWDTHLDRHVAIKMLPADRTSDPDRRRRFVQEAKTASALNHGNIVTIHDIFEEDGLEYIVMEFVEGKTLRAMIPAGGMPVDEVSRLGMQIADALATAHAAGVIHRDLKPANILVTPQRRVMVVDFGLAKLTESLPGEGSTTVTVDQTAAGVLLGTVGYLSPEQLEGRPLDARSDLFALGIVLFEMLTGKRPFSGSTRLAMM